MDLYRVSHVHFWNDLKAGRELVIFGLVLMRFNHGGVGFNVALMGLRLSVHFNTRAGIERERVQWEHTKSKLKEVTGIDI